MIKIGFVGVPGAGKTSTSRPSWGRGLKQINKQINKQVREEE